MSSLGLDLYAALGGNELWNQSRTLAYMESGVQPSRWGGPSCKPCPTLDQIVPCGDPIPDGGYFTPMDDPAPWYDADRPESGLFAGLLVTDITLSAAATRSVTENVNHGSTLGRLRLKGRTITVTGMLIGRTCCAVAYGKHWLTSALMGSTVCATAGQCGTDQLDTVSCCPCEADTLDSDDYIRTLFGVGLIEGPTVTERRAFGGGGCGGSTCGCAEVMTVEFVLASASPWFHTARTVVLAGATPSTCPPANQCETKWVLARGACPSDCAGDNENCLSDPNCADTSIPPALPVADNPCVCVPMRRTRVGVNVEAFGDWFDSAATVEVHSAGQELRNLVVRMWQNPLAVDPSDPDFFPDCAACSSLYVTYLPPNAVLTVDGEQRQVTITCGSVVRDASGLIYAATGEPFAWLDMTCTDYMIAVDFDCDHVDTAARVDVFVTGREI